MKAGGKIPLMRRFKLKNNGITIFLAQTFPQLLIH